MGKMTDKPRWCPVATCSTLRCIGDAVCVGRMATPIDHDGTPNTHRFCLNNEDGVIDLMINKSDAYVFRAALETIT